MSSLLGHFRAAKAPIVHVMQEDLPHVSQFLDTQVSLAPTPNTVTRVSDIMGWRLDLINKQTHASGGRSATRLLIVVTAMVQGARDVHR